LCCATGASREVGRFVLPSSDVHSVAISSHFGLVLASTGDSLFLLDLCSGFLIRQIPFSHAIIDVAFAEANDFVVAVSDRRLTVFALDLRIVATLELPGARRAPLGDITCFSCQPATVWLASPLFATGHSDGSVRVWELDTADWTFRECAAFTALRCSVATVHLFARCQALLMIDADSGTTFVASIEAIGARFIHHALFERCAVCDTPLRNASGALCARCGLAVCRSCVSAKRPPRCSACTQGEGEPPPSPAAEEEEQEEGLTLADVTPWASARFLPFGPRENGAVDLRYRESAVGWPPARPSAGRKRPARHTL
jgi:hypothetical protein